MFLLVSGRHVGAHLGGHQHGVSIQISINLGKTFLRISCIRKIAVTWILAGVFGYLPSLYFQILGLIYWTVLIFYFDLFWMAWHWKPAILCTSLILDIHVMMNWQIWHLSKQGIVTISRAKVYSWPWPLTKCWFFDWITGSCLVNLLKTGQDCSEAS